MSAPIAAAEPLALRQRIVIVSAFHDFRTRKKASIQQIASALVELGHDVSFVSTRFSRLSRFTGDSRLFLWDRSNRVELIDGVRCYLWRTLVHPFASRHRWLNAAMNWAYPLYAMAGDPTVDGFFRDADTVIVESSVAAILMRRVRRLNPRARIIYYATDRLDTVGAHPYVRRRLVGDAALIDHLCLRSPKMAADFDWARNRLFRAGFGIDRRLFEDIGPSPYPASPNAVAVGSMLFDASFFQIAAPRFPQVHFHVIGCGHDFDAPTNVTIHPEMPFRDTLPYIKHATIGIAPYRDAPGVEYLAESSLKLAQYEYLGLPAVCPDFAAGDNATRSAYRPGGAASIEAAVASALSMAGTVRCRDFPSWQDVARRVIDPRAFADCRL